MDVSKHAQSNLVCNNKNVEITRMCIYGEKMINLGVYEYNGVQTEVKMFQLELCTSMWMNLTSHNVE